LWFSAGAWILGRARDVSDIVSDICNVDLLFTELQNRSFFVLVSGFHAAPLSVLGGDLGCCLNWGKLHSKMCLNGSWIAFFATTLSGAWWNSMVYVTVFLTVLQCWQMYWHKQVGRLRQRVFCMR
jgi:hypothetical protein